ncbi:hypothetical protein ACFXIQ_004315 [Vibrio vulnificus]
MSLIFAKKDETGNVCIVSDTRLNYQENRELPAYSDYQKNGGLKLFLVDSRRVAIAFAGCSVEAQDAFDKIDVQTFELDKVVHTLTQSSLSKNTDYMVCHAVDNLIYRISCGQVSQPDFAYIGDFDGYQLLTRNIQHTSGLGDLERAMDVVISDANVESVGGFCISAISDVGKFRYVKKHYFSQFKGRIQLSTTPVQIPFVSNAANDTYSYAWTGDENGVGFFFYEAKLGLIYLPLTIRPVEVLPGVDLQQFGIVLSKYSLTLPVKMDATNEEESLIDFAYELYKSSQYVRCIDKVESFTSSVKVNPKVYFQANYLLSCCYKELGIATEVKCQISAVEYLERAVQGFELLTANYEPEFNVLANKGIALNYLGYIQDDLLVKKARFDNAVHDFTLALELDSKQALPYQNRAAANYELLRFCQNQYEFAQLIKKIVLDCDLALTIEPNLQIAASLKMHVLSMRA